MRFYWNTSEKYVSLRARLLQRRDVQVMSRIVLLCQCSTWCCFDALQRSEVEILAVESHQIQTVLNNAQMIQCLLLNPNVASS